MGPGSSFSGRDVALDGLRIGFVREDVRCVESLDDVQVAGGSNTFGLRDVDFDCIEHCDHSKDHWSHHSPFFQGEGES